MNGLDEGMYRRLLESSPEGMVLIDALNPDHPVVYANPGFEALTGYVAADLLGKNLRLLQGDDRDQDARHRLRESMSRGETCRVLLRNYRKDGTVFWNEVTVGLASASFCRMPSAFWYASRASAGFPVSIMMPPMFI